mmetsp:Transcript_1700/g.2721  ORF Transcript_1700/g.2721 Transcript_1700/m.2721 type:complete len:306 (-) Transcript_1700:1748-2665(-)
MPRLGSMSRSSFCRPGGTRPLCICPSCSTRRPSAAGSSSRSPLSSVAASRPSACEQRSLSASAYSVSSRLRAGLSESSSRCGVVSTGVMGPEEELVGMRKGTGMACRSGLGRRPRKGRRGLGGLRRVSSCWKALREACRRRMSRATAASSTSSARSERALSASRNLRAAPTPTAPSGRLSRSTRAAPPPLFFTTPSAELSNTVSRVALSPPSWPSPGEYSSCCRAFWISGRSSRSSLRATNGYDSVTMPYDGLPVRASPSSVTMARASSAKYGGMEKGMSLSTVSASLVMAWKPPAVPLRLPSMP